MWRIFEGARALLGVANFSELRQGVVRIASVLCRAVSLCTRQGDAAIYT
jgi:hypothetical protein